MSAAWDLTSEGLRRVSTTEAHDEAAEQRPYGRPWRIHAIAPDFRLEDVWELPTPGGRDDFPRLVELMSSFDPERSRSAPVRALFELRWKLGGLLGWDTERSGLGRRVESLCDRLPANLLNGQTGPQSPLPFRSLYVTDDEWVAETANRTVHGILHVGWVPDEHGGYHGQMAVLVKPNGVLGRAYMTAITPFRYAVVYPAILRELDREWRAVAA